MPLWSVAEWRARIGGSWCAIGRPFCKIRMSQRQEKGKSKLYRVLYDCILSLLIAVLTTLVVYTGPSLNEMGDCKLILILTLRLYQQVLGGMVWDVEKTAIELEVQEERAVLTTDPFTSRLSISMGSSIQKILNSGVAAAVITSRLMKSGDVESNPGPDIDYDSVNTSEILGADDLLDVMDELSPIMSLYYPLGRALRLFPEELESIRTKYLDESDAEKALNDVILLWLHHQKYNVDRFGPPTWRKLVEAVNHPLGGRNYEVARKIALNHPVSGIAEKRKSGTKRKSVNDHDDGSVKTSQQSKNDFDFEIVDSNQILFEEDLPDILEELTPLLSRYYSLGRSLRLDPHQLNEIRKTYLHEKDAEQALNDVLFLWLSKQYDIDRFGCPTWRALVEAVAKRLGGNNLDLAKKIASNHLATEGSSELRDVSRSTKTRKIEKDRVNVLVHSQSDRNRTNHKPRETTNKERKSDETITQQADTGSAQTAKKTPTQDCLTIDDLLEVQRYFWNVRACWKSIGIELGVDEGSISAFEGTHKGSVNDCLIDVLKTWLRQPNCSRHKMKKVLQSPMVLQAIQDTATPEDRFAQYTEQLKSCYIRQSMTVSSDKNQWPPPYTSNFFHLALVKEPIRKGEITDEFTKLTITGKVEDILRRKAPIELVEIFSKHDKCTLLFEGSPGCGKTALTSYICRQWAISENLKKNSVLFQKYKIVVLVRLREPAIRDAKDIKDILPCQGAGMEPEIAKEIVTRKGAGIMFVIDGWDELPETSSGHKVILRLISKEVLPDSTIVVTSRPTSSANLHGLVSTRIEILGFTPRELRKYLTDCLDGSISDVEDLMKKIKANPIVAGSCYLPLNASILVHLYICTGDLPTTQSGIFSSLVKHCILRHYKERTDSGISSLRSLDDVDLPEIAKIPFKHLCEIAYEGVMKDKVIFKMERDTDTLGLLQGVECYSADGTEYYYNFLHLSIQEHLAARYIGLHLDHSRQIAKFNELFGQPRFTATFQHYAAVTRLQVPGIEEILRKITNQILKAQPESQDRASFLSLLNCLYEAQESSLCELIVGYLGPKMNPLAKMFVPELRSKVNLCNTTLSPADCLSIGYFLKYAYSFDVDLSHCRIKDDGCVVLFSPKDAYYLNNLNLSDNEIGDEGAIAISAALKSMTSLQMIDLGRNRIGARGIVAIAGAMQSMTNLRELNLPYNTIGDGGAAALSDGLQGIKSLQKLDLHMNDISDRGVIALSAALKTSNLQELYFPGNKIGDAGAQAISSLIKLMNKFHMLILGGNRIGNAGAVAIATALKTSTCIKELQISGNQISEEGIEVLRELQASHTEAKIMYI